METKFSRMRLDLERARMTAEDLRGGGEPHAAHLNMASKTAQAVFAGRPAVAAAAHSRGLEEEHDASLWASQKAERALLRIARGCGDPVGQAAATFARLGCSGEAVERYAAYEPSEREDDGADGEDDALASDELC
jgi:hypothetical protein